MKILRKLEAYLRDRRLRKLENLLGWNLMAHGDIISELMQRYQINLVVNRHIKRELNEYRSRISEISKAIDCLTKVPEKVDEIK